MTSKNKPTARDREKALSLTLQNMISAPVVDVETTAILRRAKRYAKFLAKGQEPKSLGIEKAIPEEPTEGEKWDPGAALRDRPESFPGADDGHGSYVNSKPVTGDTESEQKLIDAGWNSALDYIMDEFLVGFNYSIVNKGWLRSNLGELRRS